MLQFRLPLFSASKATSFALLVLLSGFATAPGQTREHKPLPTEELEKYDNPPALLWRTGQSPRMWAAEVVKGPRRREGLAKDKSAILNARIPLPIRIPRCPRGRAVAAGSPSPLYCVSHVNGDILRREF